MSSQFPHFKILSFSSLKTETLLTNRLFHTRSFADGNHKCFPESVTSQKNRQGDKDRGRDSLILKARKGGQLLSRKMHMAEMPQPSYQGKNKSMADNHILRNARTHTHTHTHQKNKN